MIEQMRKQSQLIESHNLVEVEELRVKLEEVQLALQRERRSASELRNELAQLSQVPFQRNGVAFPTHFPLNPFHHLDNYAWLSRC